ncbi:hypothetical protein F4779DRAFT_561048 [Xylariaceae sp. FL0662B]|nr:hypothetical protein F4779DRAFT_561048 [Xylariaceae sp. FL0662B]
MASAEGLSAPGSASYDSDTMVVGDGTWDFTKNTFLLPNLVGLNFETMRYNGMGNRFATLGQYHQLVMGHGILAVITFLFIVPFAIMYARFHRGPPGSFIRMHAYLQVLAVGLSTVVFILGWFAVGPNRSLTNPHHGIGVAIYTMIILQAIGGRMVKNIRKKSLRLMIHRWGGRTVALLGIVQVPLGLTLYGSPKFTFILYALWMGFLLLLYFILSWRHENRGDREDLMVHGGRSEGGITESERRSRRGLGWLGPLAAGAGIWALLRGRKNDEQDQTQSYSRSQSRSRRSPPEVIPSQRGSASYFEDEKYSGRTDRREGSLVNTLLSIAGIFGAGALVKRIMDRREKRRYDDEEYSAVETDTPSRFTGLSRPRPHRQHHNHYTESDFTEDRSELHGARRPHTPLLPGPGGPVAASAEPEPVTPRPSRARPPHSRQDSHDISSYSSYVSPSRRTREDEEGDGGKVGKGLLAGFGLGWLAKKMKGNKDRKAEEDRLRMEDERRDGRHGSRFTGDGHGTPTRPSRRRPPPSSAPTGTSFTHDSESSMLEARPPGTSVGGPPMPPLGAGGAPPVIPVPGPGPASHSRSRSRSTHGNVTDPISMPPMPPDPHGVLHPIHPESGNESHGSTGSRMHRRHSSRRRREGERAAAAAAASGAAVAAAEDDRRQRDRSRPPSQPVSVKVKYHDDRDRNITLRRLTEEEAAASRRRRRSNSASSFSESDTPGRRRYRRDSSARRTTGESAAERLTSEPLSPPTPAFAGGRRAGKDSAYYSGQPGPSGGAPAAEQTVSSIGSPESHGTWSAMSPSPSGPATDRPTPSVSASAADRRRRRRLERRDAGTVDFD